MPLLSRSGDPDAIDRLRSLLAAGAGGGPPPRHDAPSGDEAPSAWRQVRQARWSLPATAAVAVLVLLAAVAAVVVLRTTATMPARTVSAGAGTKVAVPARGAATSGTSSVSSVSSVSGASTVPAASSPGSPVASALAPGDGQVVVDVAGRVPSPGVRRLPAGSRVDDAVRAAGGALPGADTDALNLARVLVDGEQVLVPAPGQAGAAGAGGASSGAGSAATPASGGGGAAAAASAPLSLRTATAEQLDALPGIGPVLAARIVAWRTAHGGFRRVDDLGEVSGIGPVLLGRLRPLVTV